jgi:N-acetylglucosamine kinase-like BadF-type ATPase
MELLHLFTMRRGGIPITDAALFAPVVFDVAADGDDVAGEIVRTHARFLARQAATCAARVPLPRPYPLVIAGPVFSHPAQQFRQLIIDDLTEAQPITPRFEPAAAAVLEALEEAGAARSAAELLADTMPGSEFFATRREVGRVAGT